MVDDKEAERLTIPIDRSIKAIRMTRDAGDGWM